jgi:hypothetical protein
MVSKKVVEENLMRMMKEISNEYHKENWEDTARIGRKYWNRIRDATTSQQK